MSIKMKTLTIITGASCGVGRGFARQIFPCCMSDELWLIARRKEKLEELAAELTDTNASQEKNQKTAIKIFAADISGKEGAAHFAKLLEQENAKNEISIQTLINNAGFGTYGTFENTKIERQLEMIDLNCTALTGICGYALPYMKKNSTLINVASLAAFMPLGNFAVYGATKAYVLSFTIALAAELKERGIKVCALCPGSVSTEFADVASNGARKEVLHGKSAEKVVAHCLKKSAQGRHIAIMAIKWKFSAFISHFVSRYFGASVTYKFHKRPANPF